MILHALAAALSLSASAQQVEYTLKTGAATFVELVAADSSRMSNVMKENAVSKDGSARRMLILNTTFDEKDFIQYQIELTPLDRKDPIQVQSAVYLPPGASLEVARCGNFSAKLRRPGKTPAKPGANHRITLDATFDEDRGSCWAVAAPQTQLNLIASMQLGEARRRILLNAVAGPMVQYQVEVGSVFQGQAALGPQKKLVGSKGDLKLYLSQTAAK